MKKYLVYLALFEVLFAACADKRTEPDTEIGVVFYNCENFFDTVDNPKTNDDDFTPAGKYHYTQKTYEQKLHNIASVIYGIGGRKHFGEPVILGLAEIENEKVLDDLTHQPEIAYRNYKHILYESSDRRGINVALLYEPELFTVIHSEAIPIKLGGEQDSIMATRSILYVQGVLKGDTTHIFVNHWPSRRNDDGDDGAGKRIAIAEMLKARINALFKLDKFARVLVMGDFNDNPTDSSIDKVLCNDHGISGLFNPFKKLYEQGKGTEMFGGRWNLFDQIFISETVYRVVNRPTQFVTAEIFSPPFLTDHHKGDEGAPLRSFRGTHWNNGYSDHFPVIVYLKKQ